MDEIENLCWRLRNSWDGSQPERAALWRAVYRACPEVDRERMHRIAFDYKLGEATGEEWIQCKEDVVGTKLRGLPHSVSSWAIELRTYRGYGLHTSVQKRPDTTWSVSCSVQNADWLTIHTIVLSDCASPDDAVRTALRSAADFVDSARETSTPSTAEAAQLSGEHARNRGTVRIVWLSDPTGAHGCVAAFRRRQDEHPRAYRTG